MDAQGAFAEVNNSIRQLATKGPVSELWEFFCECPSVECHSLVSLTLVEFDSRRGAAPPLPILAPHHPAA